MCRCISWLRLLSFLHYFNRLQPTKIKEKKEYEIKCTTYYICRYNIRKPMLFRNARRLNYTVCAQENLWVAKDIRTLYYVLIRKMWKKKEKKATNTIKSPDAMRQNSRHRMRSWEMFNFSLFFFLLCFYFICQYYS